MVSGINIIGTGYIGSVTALVLADAGHHINAIDIDPAIEEKTSWFSRYDDLAAWSDDSTLARIDTSTDYSDATGQISIICVDTPLDGERGIDLSRLSEACHRLGQVIGEESTVIVRSTVTPGTSEERIIPILEDESGYSRGKGFSYGYSPEFLRGGTAIDDFCSPPKQVLSGDNAAIDTCRQLFPEPEQRTVTDIQTAEAVKYIDNIFHGLKSLLPTKWGVLETSTILM